MKILDALDLAIESLTHDCDGDEDMKGMEAVAALRSLRGILSQIKAA